MRNASRSDRRSIAETRMGCAQHRRKEISETSVESWLGFQCLVCSLPDYAKSPHGYIWPPVSKPPACSIPMEGDSVLFLPGFPGSEVTFLTLFDFLV
jgi:hypothetical protein